MGYTEMTKCENCHVTLGGQLSRCPLCLKALQFESDHTGESLYPVYNNGIEKKNLKFKIFLFLSIVVCSILTLVNILTFQIAPILWFIYVLIIVIYLWIFIGHTIKSKRSIGSKILLQTLGASFLLFAIDLNSGYGKWSVNIVIPVIVMVGILFITFKMSTRKMQWNEYIGYTISMILVGFIPIILFLIGVSNILWPSAVAALFSVLAIVGMFIFADKRFKNEFIRRFHL